MTVASLVPVFPNMFSQNQSHNISKPAMH